MNSEKKTATILEDVKINIKIKLSALWATVMFIYLYVDVFGFYKPGIIEDAIAGKVWEFQITQVWLLGVIILMTIPSLMVFLSLVLPVKANRWTNIIVGILYIVVTLGMTIGESWAYYIFASIVEAVLLLLIVVYAWKWPTHERVEVTP
ncbi:MAG TPA: hypothetical protein ENF20_08600 [Candidatus Marinimicrobia bacterium]|nr:hypothetical protein [Candidatus Neomarinimicrobiota bacterium]